MVPAIHPVWRLLVLVDSNNADQLTSEVSQSHTDCTGAPHACARWRPRMSKRLSQHSRLTMEHTARPGNRLGVATGHP